MSTLPAQVEAHIPGAEAVNKFIEVLWDHAETPNLSLSDLLTLAVFNYELELG